MGEQSQYTLYTVQNDNLFDETKKLPSIKHVDKEAFSCHRRSADATLQRKSYLQGVTLMSWHNINLFNINLYRIHTIFVESIMYVDEYKQDVNGCDLHNNALYML